METKKMEKFVELAEKRMNNVIKCLRLIGNLSNRKNYDYTDDHVTEIMNTLENELRDLKRKFSAEKPGGSKAFKFKRR